uniref:gibberellin 2beta-dioxygenase n=1 Tax=Nerium oleander TaxID=63479 RepID=Q53B82_NEROL|nr:GA 2-oxidase 1 [Nerium oleander]
MVVATPTPVLNEKITRAVELPMIDLMGERAEVSKLMVKACQEFGFFKLVNHGVSQDVIATMEEESWQFFSRPSSEKERAGPPDPYGYGCKNIGFNGDVGEVEYLMLKANPLSVPPHASNDPTKFSSAVSSYVAAVRELACEILDLIGEGLRVPDTSVFSKLIKDVESDSLLRLNHYPPLHRDRDTSPSSLHHHVRHNPPHQSNSRIGFGEHTDPQILTILKSNAVAGLQISVDEGIWVPVTPHPTAFFVNVGDVLQAMTNGRFTSVRHRAMVNSYESRMSMPYFFSPPLRARISPIPEMVTTQNPRLYRSFTWADYKKATYTQRLGESRLNLYKLQSDE